MKYKNQITYDLEAFRSSYLQVKSFVGWELPASRTGEASSSASDFVAHDSSQRRISNVILSYVCAMSTGFHNDRYSNEFVGLKRSEEFVQRLDWSLET